MEHPRTWLVFCVPASPVQSEGEIDVLEISAERFRKPADSQESIAPVERTRRAGAEDASCLQMLGTQRPTMAALAGDAAQEIAVAGAIDDRCLPVAR